MKKVRLHQYLSKTTAFKNKQAIWDAIRDGEIVVNDLITKNPDFQLRLTKPVFYKGEALTVIRDNFYILINKPEGYLSSRLSNIDKKLGKKSVFSLLLGIEEEIANTLFTVGRLDEDTRGLLIITNDGNLSHKTANPEFEVEKEYVVYLELPLTEEAKARIEKGVGITLEENGEFSMHLTKPCKIVFRSEDKKQIMINISEGKKREIKRMMEVVGNKVEGLERVSIGNLRLDEENILIGKYKIVDKDYITKKLTLSLKKDKILII